MLLVVVVDGRCEVMIQRCTGSCTDSGIVTASREGSHASGFMSTS